MKRLSKQTFGHNVVRLPLKEAELLSYRPSAIPKPKRMKGSRAKGKTYERAFGRWAKREHWPDLISGQWIYYQDTTGVHYAQPDHYVALEDKILLFECKLTQRRTAETQLELLYAPLLIHIFSRPVICVQVCKVLRLPPVQEIRGPEDLEHIVPKGPLTWHWLN